jgi:PAS domain S-box-containing protein
MNQKHSTGGRTLGPIDAREFRKKFRLLIFNAWNVPAIFGLSFILYVQILSVSEMIAVMTNPLEPLFVIIWIAFSLWYFTRYTRPVIAYLESPTDASVEAALNCIRRFPLHFWALFFAYLIMAPISVIWAAELYAGFVPQPVDWFRISMVALIVSIIVGLPIFFMILDLFGRTLTGVPLARPHVTVRTKVFLIGALVPLLIDTMLVQYYWNRTGFFTTETFVVWLFLELLAIGGSLIFVRSFGQSLAPLETIVGGKRSFDGLDLEALQSQSTDEIGVLTTSYRALLNDLQIQGEMLELNNQLLRSTGNSMSMGKVANTVVSLADRAIESDSSFLVLQDFATGDLVCVAESGKDYRHDGYFRIAIDEESLATLVFNDDKTYAIADVRTDPRCSPRLHQQFKTRSALATPLRLDGKPIGVLMCTSTATQREYTERDEAVVQGLAREAALAINTQRLNERNAAGEIERREKDELIELLMNSTEEAIFGVDLDGVCIFVNRACVEMLGYDNESELLDQSIHELIHHTRADGSPYPKTECSVRQATLAQSSAHRDDEVHWRKDGTSLPVEYWSRPIRKDGEIVGTVVTFVDISERKLAEKHLKESQEQLDNVVNNASVVLFAINQGGRFTLSEGQGLQALGLEPGQVVGMAAEDVYKDFPHVLRDIRRALAGDAFTAEANVGGIIFEVHYSPIRNDDGEVAGTMGVAVDITERVKTQQELEQSTERLELAIEAGEIGIWEWDIATGRVDWSDNVEQIFGLEQKEFKGTLQDYNSRVFPDDIDMLGQSITDALEKGKPFFVEHRIVRGDGSIGWIYGQAKVRRDDTGSPLGMVGVVADITERKQAEEEIRRHREHLEELVEERTTELRAVNKELESFAYSVSHDLRAPLRSIDGFSLALLEDYNDKLDSNGRDYLNRVRNSAQRMSVLIDDLLELSRVTRSEINREIVELSALASGVTKELATGEPERKVAIQVAEGVTAEGDKRLLKVVLDNLLGNAWKYTGKTDKAEIEFGVIDKGGRAAYYVRDNGAGFDMKYADKLFGAFQRLHKAEEFPGTGIGLATVQRIVHRHGGQVWAEGKPGGGATFFFSLNTGVGGDNGE